MNLVGTLWLLIIWGWRGQSDSVYISRTVNLNVATRKTQLASYEQATVHSLLTVQRQSRFSFVPSQFVWDSNPTASHSETVYVCRVFTLSIDRSQCIASTLNEFIGTHHYRNNTVHKPAWRRYWKRPADVICNSFMRLSFKTYYHLCMRRGNAFCCVRVLCWF